MVRFRILLALFVLAPRPLPAAEATQKPGRFQLGPLHLTPRLVLKNAGVDDNVFNSESSPVSDTTVVLSPTLDAAMRIGRRVRLTGTGFLDFTWYESQSAEGGTDGGGSGRVEVDVSRFTLSGEGGASSAKQRYSPDLDLRVRRHESFAAAGLRARISSRFSLGGSAKGSTYRYDSALVEGQDVREQLDRDSRILQGELRFALSSLTSLVFSAEGIEDTFVSDPAGAPVARSRRYLGGFELGPKAVFSGRVLLGRRVFEEGSTAVPPYSGLALAITAAAPLHGVARLLAAADRDVQYSANPAQTPQGEFRNSYVWDHYGAQLEVDLPLELLARGSVAYDRTSYVLPNLDAGVYKKRTDQMWTLGASLLRRFGSALRLGVTLSHQDRASNFSGASFQALRYGLQAELVP